VAAPERRRWRGPQWLTEGQDPDYRFSLANERTFLAWIRTVLAFLAASVAVVQLATVFRTSWARTALATALAVSGLVVCTLAYARWAGNERAMRNGRPLPFSPLLLLLNVALAAIAIMVLALIVFDR
jgi:putative membrane protein